MARRYCPIPRRPSTAPRFAFCSLRRKVLPRLSVEAPTTPNLTCIRLPYQAHAARVSRILPVISAFVLGVAVSRWLMIPATTTLDHTAAPAPHSSSATTPVTMSTIDRVVGVPPDTATPVTSAPNAGQRRALSRALRDLEQTTPSIDPDPELAAHLAEKIREHFTPEGDQP